MNIVGDSRILMVFAVDPADGSKRFIGSATQDGNGQVKGTGVVATMVCEEMARARLIRTALSVDESPLSVLRARISSSPFMVTRFEEAEDGEAA